MDSESQTNINSGKITDETNTQSWEIFINTSVPIHENIDWNISKEQAIQENNEWNRYELKPKKGNKSLVFLLWILVWVLLSSSYFLVLNNNWTSFRMNDKTINNLVSKISAFGNTVNNVVVDKSKLSWTYATDNSKYIIDFNKDWTLRWRQVDEYKTLVPWETKQGDYFPEFRQQTQQQESFYEWTYEYNNWEYILYVKWWYFAADTVFHATSQSDWSLRIVGWTVHNELFRKKS